MDIEKLFNDLLISVQSPEGFTNILATIAIFSLSGVGIAHYVSLNKKCNYLQIECDKRGEIIEEIKTHFEKKDALNKNEFIKILKKYDK